MCNRQISLIQGEKVEQRSEDREKKKRILIIAAILLLLAILGGYSSITGL